MHLSPLALLRFQKPSRMLWSPSCTEPEAPQQPREWPPALEEFFQSLELTLHLRPLKSHKSCEGRKWYRMAGESRSLCGELVAPAPASAPKDYPAVFLS